MREAHRHRRFVRIEVALIAALIAAGVLAVWRSSGTEIAPADQAATESECQGPLATDNHPGQSQFYGFVTDVRTEPFEEYGAEWSRVSVTTTSVRHAQPPDRDLTYGGRTVNLVDRKPSVSVGDCVFVAGSDRGFACGPTCDARGFVADKFAVVNASSTSER